MKITIIGCGSGAFASAADLSSKGHEVTLYADSSHKKNFKTIKRHGAISAFGKGPVGTIDIKCITCDEAEAFKDPDVIIVCTPANAHEDIAARIAPYLKSGEVILLSPGGTGGALIFSRTLQEQGAPADLLIGEFHTLPYTARKVGDYGIRFFLMVRFLMFAAFPADRNEEMFEIIKGLYPQASLAADVIETGLNNGNATTHPAPVVLNAGKIEYYGRHNHYEEGITPSVAKVVQLIDDERKAICRAMGYEEIDIKERLFRMGYCPKADTLYESIQRSTKVFIPVKGPDSLTDRYLTEDTPMSLVFMSCLAKAAGVATPLMDSVINLASGLLSEDYMKTGRTLEAAGISGMSLEEIKEYVRTGKASASP